MSRTVLVFATGGAVPADLLAELRALDGVVTATDIAGDDLVLAVECDDIAQVIRRVRDAVVAYDDLAREIYHASDEAAELFVRRTG